MPECHSTNTIALELCQQPATAEGTLVVTNKQSAGRGQRGNTWESHPGMNLTCSLILKPVFLAVKDQFLLSVVTSLAVRDYLTQTCRAPIHIKWPNDILVNEFKICGILIENQLQGEKFSCAVIGIGLNVNQQQFLSSSATSLSLVTNKSHELQDVLEGVVAALEVRYLQLRQNKLKELKDEYERDLFRLQEMHTFTSADEQFTGKIVGVDGYGRLRVLTHEKERTFGIKEISFAD